MEPSARLLLGPEHKGLPPIAWGLEREEFLRRRPVLSHLPTPVLTVDDSAVEHNTRTMAAWAQARGLALAPHGKTSMAPELWRRQLDAGAWGITLATPWQVQVARRAGVDTVLLANGLVDPVGIAWVCGELDRDPAFRFVCWVDGVEAVDWLATHARAAASRRPLDVLVELGGAGGRTGARDLAAARRVASAVARSGVLRLVGVGGYEGALAHDRTVAGLAAVRRYLERLRDLAIETAPALEAAGVRPMVSAGGSAFPDLVAEVLAPLVRRCTVVLRSGAYQLHDSGFYEGISPFGSPAEGPALRAALHVWSRVISRPEPDLAILDAGKRDLPFDEGLPRPELLRGRADSAAVLSGSRVSAVNDQHAFLRLSGEREADLAVGDVIRLGISHPCTALDKWRILPVVDSADAEEPALLDIVPTSF